MFKAIKEFFLGKAPEAPKVEVPAEAPYKVETPAPVAEPVSAPVESAPVAETPAPVVEKAPAKKRQYDKKPKGQGAPKKGGRKPKAKDPQA